MKEVGLGLTVLALLAMGFRSQSYQAEVKQLSAEYDQRIAELTAAGIPTHPREWIPASIPDDQNVMAGVREALRWVGGEIKARKLEHYCFVGVGEYPYSNSPVEELEALKRESVVLLPFVDRLKVALQRPRFVADVTWEDRSYLRPMRDIHFIQEAMNGLEDYVRLSPPAERTERLIRSARIGLELSKRTDMPFLIGSAIPDMIVWNVLEMLWEHATVASIDAATVLRALDAEFRALASQPYTDHWLPQERTLLLFIIEYWRRDAAHPALPNFPSFGRRTTLRDGIRMIDETVLWVSQETNLANAWRARDEYKGVDERLRCTRWMTRFRALAQTHYVEGVARLRMAGFALRVLAHRQAQGVWPAVADLEGPLDPWQNKPCRYELTPTEVRLWMPHPDHDAASEKGWSELLEEDLAWSWKR